MKGGVVMALAALLGVYAASGSPGHTRQQIQVQACAESHLLEWMGDIEEDLGIRFRDIPNIVTSDTGSATAEYWPRTDTIILRPASYSHGPLLDDCTLHFPRLERTMKHELGHFFMDKFNERRYGVDWDLHDLNDEWRLAKLLSEGVGEYFAIGRNPIADQRGMSKVYTEGLETVRTYMDDDVEGAIAMFVDYGAGLRESPKEIERRAAK